MEWLGDCLDVMHGFFSECCTLLDAQVRTNAFIILLKLRFPGIMSSELNQPNVVEDLVDVWQKFETADRRAEELNKTKRHRELRQRVGVDQCVGDLLQQHGQHADDGDGHGLLA